MHERSRVVPTNVSDISLAGNNVERAIVVRIAKRERDLLQRDRKGPSSLLQIVRLPNFVSDERFTSFSGDF